MEGACERTRIQSWAIRRVACRFPAANPGIRRFWICHREDAAVAQAKRLMAYQAKRQQRVREEYNAAKEAGTAETFWTVVWAEPARVALTVLGIFFMLALVALPIILLRR